MLEYHLNQQPATIVLPYNQPCDNITVEVDSLEIEVEVEHPEIEIEVKCCDD